MNKLICEETPMGDEYIDVFSKLEESRTFFIYEEITDDIATYISANILQKSQESKEDITLFINSPGGDIRNVFMIYDAMQMVDCTIKTVCSGAAEDEAVLLLVGGTPGFRFATPHATIGIDKLKHYGMGYSDLIDAAIMQRRLKINNDMYLKAMQKHCPKIQLKTFFEEKKYLTPVQAKKIGIIDGILGPEKGDV